MRIEYSLTELRLNLSPNSADLIRLVETSLKNVGRLMDIHANDRAQFVCCMAHAAADPTRVLADILCVHAECRSIRRASSRPKQATVAKHPFIDLISNAGRLQRVKRFLCNPLGRTWSTVCYPAQLNLDLKMRRARPRGEIKCTCWWTKWQG